MKTGLLVLSAFLGLSALDLHVDTAMALPATARFEGRLCAGKSDGKLVIRKRCKKQEEELTREALLSKGETGPQGSQGPQGPQGLPGGIQDIQVVSCVVSNQSTSGLLPCPNDLALDCPAGYRLLANTHDLYSGGSLFLHTYYTICVK